MKYGRGACGCILVAGLAWAAAESSPRPIADKTLVAWVAVTDLAQRGGGVLTLENPGGEFDAIVLGELAPARWMAGSNSFARTHQDQRAWPAETARGDSLLQVAIAYRGKDVTIFRNGAQYAKYTMGAEPAAFNTASVVLMGLRHRDAGMPRYFTGEIADARIYDRALDAAALAALRPDEVSEPRPLAWWRFDSGKAEDAMGVFPAGTLMGGATIERGRLVLAKPGSYLLVNAEPSRDRAHEQWPAWHVTALPDEGLCRPYDANGCIYWKGVYHLMYIFQDPSRPNGGHCWGHASSKDLVNWTFHPATVVPAPGDPDTGIFSGNAFVNREGVPMLCWFGIDAGVCVATAQDDDLLVWKKHPKNPIIPIPKPGQPGHGVYTVWDPYLWFEDGEYLCLLGGNKLPNGKDTLYLCTSSDLVTWTARYPFYEHPDLTWTVPSEDCSCPDFFKLGDKRVLLCISHSVGGRCYIGKYENKRFLPERLVRMNWPGGNFFAPESLVDDKGRRIIWAWVTDPRLMSTQGSTGSGVQSLPRVVSLAADGTLRIEPVKELESLRRNHRTAGSMPLADGVEATIDGIRGDSLELAVTIEPGAAQRVGLKVRASADGREATAIEYDRAANVLRIDMSRSTLRSDVVYRAGPIETGNTPRKPGEPHPKPTVEAPFILAPGEALRLRVFLDKSMLEVFANERQCITQQIFPSLPDSSGIRAYAAGGAAKLGTVEAWDMAAATFTDSRGGVAFEDRFEGALGAGWTFIREAPANHRLREGGFEIRVEPGDAGSVKNALVRPAPDRRKGRFAVEVTVTNLSQPTKQYEQAGITWYVGGNPVFKLVKELVDGQICIIPGRKALATQSVRLRVVIDGDDVTAQFRPDGAADFETAATAKLPPYADDKVSLQCYQGPEAEEHWMRFDDFAIVPLGPAK